MIFMLRSTLSCRWKQFLFRPLYVNTRMLQTVLAEPAWHGRMAPEDYRCLTPLIYAHVNPTAGSISI